MYCFEIFRISFGLAKLDISKIANCERGEEFTHAEFFQL